MILFRRPGAAVVASLAAVALAASTLGPTGVPAQAREAQTPAKTLAKAPAAFRPAPVTWGKCASASLQGAGARCGFLTVPMDYARPTGRTLKLAISRVRATAPAGKRQGVLLANPGGPGGSGLGLSAYLADALPSGVASTYDLIGFDPRGVGRSKPALSCIPGYAKGPRPAYEPMLGELPLRSPNETAWLQRAKQYADVCAAKHGDLLPHLSTLNAVRDLETLRRALKVKKINFYGFSYGTYLGQVYATLYPKHTRRMVWDGVVDPREVWYSGQLNQDRAFERAVEQFWTWVARHADTYALGDTAAEVESRFYAVQSRLAQVPDGSLGAAEWNDAFVSAAYYESGWPDVAEAFAAYVTGRSGPMKAIYAASAAGGDNGYAMYLAVQCVDAAWPRDYEVWRTDAFATASTAPFLTWNNVWYNAPCLFWSAPGGTPVPVSGARAPKVLLINTTLDGATPFAGALEARRRFPRAVLVAEQGSTTHANSLNGNACVDRAVHRYLRDGHVPKRTSGDGADVVCKRSPLPKP